MSRGAEVTIVGLGPRGLGVLERLLTVAAPDNSPRTLLEVHVIDPNCTGAGVHVLDQPDYLQTHSPASEITMFPDSASLAGEPDRAEPNLFEWARRRGVRVPEGPGCAAYRPVHPTDRLPRRVLGEYLNWFLEALVARAETRARIRFHRDVAVDAREGPDGRIVVTCRGGREVSSDFLFITLGYGQSPGSTLPRAAPLPPFPMPQAIARVPAGAAVGVSGFGLTALDIVSCLTVGRGGSFKVQGADLEYIASGLEPSIVMFSRSGVPARARPQRTGDGADHAPAVLTDELVRRLRSRGPGTLEFETDVQPLIEIEMRAAYWRTFARGMHRSRVDEAAAVARQRGVSSLTAVLDSLDAEHGSIDVRALFTGEGGMSLRDSASYEQWVRAYIEADLENASRDPGESPVKAALETVKGNWEAIRAIVGHGTLAERSHKAFTAVHGPRLQRIAMGPIADRQAELVALLRAGVVRAPLGPDPAVVAGADGITIRSRGLLEPAEVGVFALLPGYVRTPRLDGLGPEMVTNLAARGMLRPCGQPDSGIEAVEVDEHMHPRDRSGRPNPRIWLFGPICEGTTFYTHVLPEPGVRSGCVVDAHRAVVELLDSNVAAGR